MTTLGAELGLILRLFAHDAARQRKRMALTVLAIAWGTLSIVLLLSFGEGLKRSFHKNTRGMGEGIAVLWPGATKKPFEGLPAGRPVSFRDDDSALLRARVPEIALISAEYQRRRGLTVGAKTVNARICGVEPDFGEIRNHLPLPGGRFLNERDLAEKRRVIFLGDELAKDLFGTTEAVGKTLQIDQSTFTVIGVMQPKVQMGMYSGPDKNQARMPATTFKAMFTDARPGNLVYKPRSPAVADQAKASVYRVLGAKYRFDPEDERAVGMWDTRENQRVTDNISLGIQLFLGIIGALTLFVGGHGRREHHVRGGEGANARDRSEDGARGEGAAGDGPLRPGSAAHHRGGGRPRNPGRGGPDGGHRRPAPEGRRLRLHGPADVLAGHRPRHHPHPGRHRLPGRVLPRPPRGPRQPGGVAAL